MSQTAAARPRLLVLASTYPRWAGDPEPGFVHELARRLVDRFDVTVVGPHAAGAAVRERMDGVAVRRYRYAPASLETLVNHGGIVSNLRRGPWKLLLLPGFALAQSWATWRAIREEHPDVVHAHWLVPQGLVVALLGLITSRPPLVVTSHGADLFALRGAFWRAIKRFVARRAAAVTVVSSVMLGELGRLGVDPARMSVQSMGVDLQSRFVRDASVARAQDELLFVGRLVPKKGLEHLLQAMPHILASRPGTRLLVAGFGPDEARHRETCRSLGLDGCVRFLGAIEQAALPGLYRHAALFVAPFVEASGGDQEGLGLVLVEAAGCGCPVLVGDVPAVRDVIREPAIGSLVAVKDPVVLADGVLAALARLPETDADEQRRAQAVSSFDWASRADAYATLLAAQVRIR